MKLESLKRLLFVFPLLFLLELVFGEAGNWLEFGPLSIRQALFALSVLSLYGYAALNWRSLRFARLDLVVLFFLAVNTLWGFLVPAFYGRSMGLPFADISAVYVLLLYFPLAALIRAGKVSWSGVKGVFVGTVSLLALAQLVIWTIGTIQPAAAAGIRNFLLAFYEVQRIFIGPMPDGFFRVMPVTVLLLIPAFFITAHVLVEKRDRSLSASLVLFLLGSAIVVAYTRTLWFALLFGLAVAALTALLQRRGVHVRSQRLAALTRSTLPLLVFAVAFLFLGMSSTVLDEIAADPTGNRSPQSSQQAVEPEEPSPANRATSTFDTEDQSVSTKLEQLPYLVGEWTEAPLFGQGFGASVDNYIRSESAPFSYELTAPNLLMKLGIVGAVLWLAPLIYLAANALRSTSKGIEPGRARFAVAGFLCFGVSIQANPFLFNFVGMTVMLFYMLEFADIENARFQYAEAGEQGFADVK